MTSLDFDDTGELAIVARDDDTLQIYNCKEGKHAKELKSQKYGVHLARFSHHAQSIIYASTKVDDTIRFLSTHDNSYIRYFRGHTDTVTSIALCPSSDTFLSCSRDNTVRLWNLSSNHCQGQLKLHAPYLATYDPSATVIAIASPPTHSILLYDLRMYDKPPFASFDLQGHEARYLRSSSSSANSNNNGGGAGGAAGGGGGGAGAGGAAGWSKLEFTNDGKALLLGTTGIGHFVLDAFTGDLTHFLYRKAGPSGRRPPGTPPASSTHSHSHGNPSHNPAASLSLASPAVGQGDVCVAPDGQFVVGGSGEDGLLVWDVSKVAGADGVAHPVAELPGQGRAAVVGYNQRMNLVVSADRDLVLWQPDPDCLP